MATEISQLKQIGTAAALYAEDSGGPVTSVRPLIATGMISSDLCSSPLDYTQRGMANALLEDLASRNRLYAPFITKYRNSYLGLGDLGWPQKRFEEEVAQMPNAGWLVSLTESYAEKNSPVKFPPHGTYRRLLLVGSVVTRQHQRFTTDDGEQAWSVIDMFVDQSVRWQKDHFGH